MELRVLRYFVTVIREQSISGAAQKLRITQPTLSRQLTELEDELGVQLLIRSRNNRRVEPTEAGRLLLERAEEIIALADRVRTEVTDPLAPVAGNVSIGVESAPQALPFVAEAAANLRRRHPDTRFHFFSGNDDAVEEGIEKGLLDFGVSAGTVDRTRREALPLPALNVWGLIMRRDDPLAVLPRIPRDDLLRTPLIVPQAAFKLGKLEQWFEWPEDHFNVAATYDQVSTALALVSSGLGVALALQGSGEPEYRFRPLEPLRTVPLSVVWKRGRILASPAALFLRYLRSLAHPGAQADV